MSESRKVKIGRGGRIVIPAAYRRALGLEEGDEVTLRLDQDEVRIVSQPADLRRAQALIARYVPPDVRLVDELIAERRREAAREDRDE